MLDVRETKEYEGGRVPNAVHMPLSQLASRGEELAKFTARPVIAYCERGNRSRSAAGALAKLGFARGVYAARRACAPGRRPDCRSSKSAG